MGNLSITHPNTALGWMKFIYHAFQEKKLTYAEQESWWLLEALTGTKKSRLLATHTLFLTDEQHKTLITWLHQLTEEKMPLQYVIGHVAFNDCTIHVRPPFLIPRQETEAYCNDLAQALQVYVNEPLHILDLCTGTGCIALSLAQSLPQAQIYGIDIIPEAIKLAQQNSAVNAITNALFIYSNLYDNVPKNLMFDLIVANPPYVTHDEWEHLDPYVKDWEDYQALVAHDDGLAVIKQIIRGAVAKINHFGPLENNIAIPQLVIEIGHTQADRVIQLYHDAGFANVWCVEDITGIRRFICGRIKHATKDLTKMAQTKR